MNSLGFSFGVWGHVERKAYRTVGHNSDAGKSNNVFVSLWTCRPSEILVLSTGPEVSSSLTVLYAFLLAVY